jgi:hypothetical protein
VSGVKGSTSGLKLANWQLLSIAPNCSTGIAAAAVVKSRSG